MDYQENVHGGRTDMSRVKEPKAMSVVLIFAIIFMVGFGIWYAPVLDLASKAVPHFGKVASLLSNSSSSLSRPAKTVYVPYTNSSRAVATTAFVTPITH